MANTKNLREDYDEGGNTPLHLLCRGRFEKMIKLLQHFPPATIQDIRRYAEENKCDEIAKLLLQNGCSILTMNRANQTALDVLLSDFKQVYTKPLINIDYVRILNELLPRYKTEHVKTPSKLVECCQIVQHLAVNEEVTEDIKQLLGTLKSLGEHATKHIAGLLIQVAARTETEETPGNVSKWLSASLEHIPEEKLLELFRDSKVKKSLVTLLKAAQRPVAQSVLAELSSWQFHQSTLLHEIVAQGDEELISAFCSLNPCIKLNNLHQSPLVFARIGNFVVAQRLLSRYQDLELAPSDDVTDSVLFSAVRGVAKSGCAVKDGSAAEAIMFVKAVMSVRPTSVNFNHRDCLGRTALMTLLQFMGEEDCSQRCIPECHKFANFLIGHTEFAADAVDMNQRNTLMHTVYALSHNPSSVRVCTDIFKMLINKSDGCINTPDKDGRCLLIYLINELNNCKTPEQRQCLEKLAETVLVIPKTDVNAVDSEDRNALIHAVLNNSKEIVKCLLDNGADVNQVDKLQETAASFAVFLTHEEILSVLLNVPTLALDITDKNRQTLLHKLANLRKQEFEVLTHLLATREDVSLMEEDLHGNFPVYIAVRNENCPQPLLKTLIMDSRFKMLVRNSKNESVLDILEETGKLETCQLEEDLANKFTDELKQTTWSEPILQMARRLKGIQSAQDKCGKTALMYALTQGVERTDEKFVSSESVNLQDNLDQSVIHYMLDYEAYHMLQLVLEFNCCDIYARDNTKRSAVLKATLRAPVATVELFFNHPQFDVLFIEEEPTKTTLDLFADGGRQDQTTGDIFDLFHAKLEEMVKTNGWEAKLVKMFLRIPRCMIDTCDKLHETALNYAVRTQNMKLALDIMETCSPDVNHKREDGNTPLIDIVHWLKSKGQDEWSEHEKHLLVAMLEHQDTDVNLSNAAWQTPLSLAIESENDELVESLLACESLGLQVATATFRDQRYRLCQHIMAKRSAGLLHALLNHRNFELNASDWNEENESIDDGRSLFILILKAHWTEGCEVLLDQRFLRFDVEDREGLTPLMHAIKELSADEVRKILKHPNCKLTYTNRYDQKAADQLQSLLSQRQDTTEKERIQKMIEKRTAEAESELYETVPKDVRSLRAAIEAIIQAHRDRQRDRPLSPREKEEEHFLIHIFVENITSLSNSEHEVRSVSEHQFIYLQHYALFRRELEVDETFLAVLRSEDVLTDVDLEEIALSTIARPHKVYLVLCKLMYAGAAGYEAFKKGICTKKQDYLIETMERPNPDFPAILEELERRQTQVRDQGVQTVSSGAFGEPCAILGARDIAELSPPMGHSRHSSSLCGTPAAMLQVCSVREADNAEISAEKVGTDERDSSTEFSIEN